MIIISYDVVNIMSWLVFMILNIKVRAYLIPEVDIVSKILEQFEQINNNA